MCVKKILHVEDDEDIQAIALIALETIGGFDVCQCSSGQDALNAVGAYKPDLYLLDAMMPGMSGIETLAALRQAEDAHNVPAVFMTAKAQENEISEFLNCGATGVITKPFDPMLLAGQILEIIADDKVG